MGSTGACLKYRNCFYDVNLLVGSLEKRPTTSSLLNVAGGGGAPVK